ncbi:hypothetical protein PUNSTDRAFT_144834 [Punctularia strigosozonata HHB-11173 SS5]|uniref:uncharacterized protein n=1 Tax=Punctularia strigosozonata (strain HHB-11173) TaxID=741275 RepID=UPI0004416440|nr:uncharacterized protein PUNSTDRAFT_144834 [Punctularia strigosozonata HHB-11173 SS5]EIN07325.1 hypothetical protein PUNSTDRAFT_144834 [Punctularia strigosozonata HHB-11173 SS5]
MASQPPPYSANPPPGSSRQAYNGPRRKLLIALDVGTTFSGISYSILEPGEIPQVLWVTRFPGQEHQAGTFKIPTVMWYDRSGVMKAAGAEAELPDIVDEALDHDWIKAEWFKMHLRPRSMLPGGATNAIKPLPARTTVVQVFGDFLKYMLSCAKTFIEDSHGNGRTIWSSCKNDIQFVLTHPNGWEGAQQSKMREAAIHGGLIPDTIAGRDRVSFVTEGEASLHSCLANGLAGRLELGDGILIADAGGGTLDFSSYKISALRPLKIQELVPASCSLQGSIFVSARAKEFFRAKLANSRYGTPDSIDYITRKFDETTKRLFRDPSTSQVVAFGSPVDRDPNFGIRNGQLRLTGNDVLDFFEPSVQAAKTTISQHVADSRGVIKSVFLVGGFAASPWLLRSLQDHFAGENITISRPDGHTSKAVAEGAVIYYLDHLVTSRVARFTYGTSVFREYDPDLPEHLRRSHLVETHSRTGRSILDDGFSAILRKNTAVTETKEFSGSFVYHWGVNDSMSHHKAKIMVYRGRLADPQWLDEDRGGFSTLCSIKADMSGLRDYLSTREGKNGREYISGAYEIVFQFGAEMKAQMSWMENGIEKRSPAQIIYED